MSSTTSATATTGSHSLRAAFERLVRQQFPRGTRLISVRSTETGTFRFKHSFRYELSVRMPSGARTTVRIRGNIPSPDRPYETATAARLHTILARRGFLNGPLRVPKPFGVIMSASLNLYYEYDGITLEKLITSKDPRAVRIAARAGEWLARLHSLKLHAGSPLTADAATRDAGYFRDNVRIAAPALYGRMIRATYTVAAAMSKICEYHSHSFCTIHGDLNLGNILASSAGDIAFIDFGNSVVSDPLSDVGNFLAQLDLLTWKKQCSRSQRTALANAFLRSYRRHTAYSDAEFTERVAIHHAWWVLQIASYTLAVAKPLGRRIATQALTTAEALLQTTRYPLSPLLEHTPKAGFRSAILNPGTMHAFFWEHRNALYPGFQKIESLNISHRSALSVSSYLTRFSLDCMRVDGTIVRKTIRGNFVDYPTFRIMEAVYRAKHRSFSTMRPLLFEHRHGYEFYEEVSGAPLRDVPFTSSRFDRILPRIARAVADFHTISTHGLRRLSLQTEAAMNTRNRRRILQHLPHERAEISRAFASLARAERALWHSNHAIVHNDFQASNIIVDGSRIGLIDFTLSAVGNRCIDVGTFLSHLTVMLHGVRSARAIDALKQRFVQAYLARVPVSHRAEFRAAISVFELRSVLDILAITLINLGPRDPNRKKYVTLLLGRIHSLGAMIPS